MWKSFSRRLLKHKKSNCRTIPFHASTDKLFQQNLTPQMNEDDYWDVVVPKSHTAQFWYDDTKTRHADTLPVFWTSRISGESA